MKRLNWRSFCKAFTIMLVGFCVFAGCDSGEKALDDVTGNRAVKQYHKSKKRHRKDS